MTQLTCTDLTLGYGTRAVASHLSFSVSSGDYLAIVGENGSGKTTLMKTLLSLMPPLGGEIVYGDGITDKDIGYLPQITDHQRDFPASVEEVVLSGCLSRMGHAPFYRKAQREIARRAMEQMGISELRSRSIARLSGGQRQRVLLARALASGAKLLLLDEPTAGLDPAFTRELYRLIAELNRRGVTVIMITHDMHAARLYATHVLHVGEHGFFGRAEDYFADGAHDCHCEEDGEEEHHHDSI